MLVRRLVWPILFGPLFLAGCNRHQSALAPFGAEAAEVRTISWVLLIGAAVLYLAVAMLAVLAFRAREGALSHRGGMRLVLWAGAVLPTLILGALLVYALPAMRTAPTRADDLRITVTGEQFWWRMAYRPPGGGAVTGANELRLPVGRTVVLELRAEDVLHSLWVPGLAGKMDMIPGRTNRLVVRADKPGRYRGVCAEFCGLSHALMAFDVVAMPAPDFDRWLAGQGMPARRGDDRAFAANGCGGCHAVRGTAHRGTIGPDLTHFASRATLAAGILPRDAANIARFVRDAPAVKPGARMPAYPQLSPGELAEITRYLEGLQ